MFDLNTIVNAAIAEAVNARITEVLAQHANIVGGLTERIAALENAISHKVQIQQANITAALAERVAALEDQAIVASNRINDRIDALENNPAQGVDTTALDVPHQALLTALDQQEWFWHKVAGFVTNNSEITANDLEVVKDRLSALESRSDDECLTRGDVESLITQAVEEAMEEHTSNYDHDSYDNATSTVEDYDFDDFMKKGDGDLEEVVRDTIRNMTFEAR